MLSKIEQKNQYWYPHKDDSWKHFIKQKRSTIKESILYASVDMKSKKKQNYWQKSEQWLPGGGEAWVTGKRHELISWSEMFFISLLSADFMGVYNC